MKQKAKKNATEAFNNEKARTKQFDTAAASQELRLSDTPENLEHPQPSIFKGNLKGYQLKGMNWLANLYDQVRNYISYNAKIFCYTNINL
jgi:DNA helicase INO80